MHALDIDLRSDTITVPTKEMLEYMFSAKVGDDVWEEDETVKSLESEIAALFSQEAALFCPSGTMSNQIAIRAHTRMGDEVICDQLSHIYNYEGGGLASNSGVSAKLVQGDFGRMSVDHIKSNINPDDPHFSRTRLVCLENTVNKGGGVCYSYENMKNISNFCRDHNLMFHLDGARIFNALVAKSDSSFDYGKLFDSISICLSKGLGAPIGSLLLGSSNFIAESKRIRKSFGGGMRQVGYLAAAGKYALQHHVNRLEEDHLRAQKIGSILRTLHCVENLRPVETNIVLFDFKPNNTSLKSIKHFHEVLINNNIKASFMGSSTVRFVTHLGFCDDKLDVLLKVLKSLD